MKSIRYLFILCVLFLVLFVVTIVNAEKSMKLELNESEPLSNCAQNQVTNAIHDDSIVYVTMCDETQNKYSFKHYIVDVKPNPKHPFIAVFTSSYYDKDSILEDSSAYPDELFIIDILNNKKYQYKYAETPECHYNLWSPDGNFAAFCHGIDIVKHDQLKNYLLTSSGIYRKVNINKNQVLNENNPAETMEVVGWKSENELVLTTGCCGYIWKTEYNIQKDSFRRLECTYGYCMCTEFDDFATLQKDIIIYGGTITKYEVTEQLKRYFDHIKTNCFIAQGHNSQQYLKEEFTISFTVDNKGKVKIPKVRWQKTSSSRSDSSQLKICLEKNTGVMSFKNTEKSDSISIKVMFGKKKGRCRF